MARVTEVELPELYRPWIASLLEGPIPAESEATCDDCAMLRPADGSAASSAGLFFDPRTKCCTYVPALPNFLVGRILLDERPDGAAGRSSVAARIAAGVGVVPAGLQTPPAYLTLYRNAHDAFGQSASMRCPHYLADSGGCGIWRHRQSICATWYCKHVRGEIGHRFWITLKHLLLSIERSLIAVCIGALDPGMDAVDDLLAERERDGLPSLSASDLDGIAEPGRRQRIWGRYAGREAEFYKASARLVEAFTWDDVVRVGGAQVELAAMSVRLRYQELLSMTLPDRVQAGVVQVTPIDSNRLRVTAYRPIDPIVMPHALYDVLHMFDGRSTRSALRAIASAGGPEIDRGVVRRLVDYGVLVEAGQMGTAAKSQHNKERSIMANPKTKAKSKKRVAVKDLKPKNSRNVKGGDFSFTAKTDKSSTPLMK